MSNHRLWGQLEKERERLNNPGKKSKHHYPADYAKEFLDYALAKAEKLHGATPADLMSDISAVQRIVNALPEEISAAEQHKWKAEGRYVVIQQKKALENQDWVKKRIGLMGAIVKSMADNKENFYNESHSVSMMKMVNNYKKEYAGNSEVVTLCEEVVRNARLVLLEQQISAIEQKIKVYHSVSNQPKVDTKMLGEKLDRYAQLLDDINHCFKEHEKEKFVARIKQCSDMLEMLKGKNRYFIQYSRLESIARMYSYRSEEAQKQAILNGINCSLHHCEAPVSCEKSVYTPIIPSI